MCDRCVMSRGGRGARGEQVEEGDDRGGGKGGWDRGMKTRGQGKNENLLALVYNELRSQVETSPSVPPLLLVSLLISLALAPPRSFLHLGPDASTQHREHWSQCRRR
eukprot:765362-Hanusia_phi.AAC.3